MSEDSKYYVLTIEDVEFGLEYEERIEDEWIGKVCDLSITTPDIINLDTDIGKYYYIKHNDYRVKHLDREDIEGFGFSDDSMFTDHNTGRYLFYKENATTSRGSKTLGLYFVPQTNWVMLFFYKGDIGAYSIEYKDTGSITHFYNNAVFAGQIKNKSELGRVLRQIGVTSDWKDKIDENHAGQTGFFSEIE